MYRSKKREVREGKYTKKRRKIGSRKIDEEKEGEEGEKAE